jgi:phage terminase large subunit
MSEYAYMDPESWYTLEPRISQNNGTAVFLSTPNGQNHFYNLYNYAKTKPKEYFTSLLSVDDTRVLDSHHIDNLRAEGVPEDFIQQEYYCSFTRGAEGSYYGKQIQKARDEDRITSLPIISDIPCSTAWDIGIGDSTSIWVYQVLNNGKINLLQYYENHGEGIEHYIKWLDRWKIENGALWERHFVPHDMANKQFATGNDLLVTARQFGIEATVVPKKSIEEGIQAVRSTLALCSFDDKRCKKGIECLDFYRKRWNDILKVYNDEPLHDKYSHGADAFRYLCVGLKAFGAAGKLSPEKILEMRQRNLGY